MFCNRGIYHQGWTAVTRHSTPWVADAELPAFDDDVWELYAPDDWTQSHNIAAENPAKLAELQRLFLIEAVKYNVLPLDDRRVERFNSDLAGRPTLVQGQRPSCCSAAWAGSARTRCSTSRTSRTRSPPRSSCPTAAPTAWSSPRAARSPAGRSTSSTASPTYCHNLLGLHRFKIAGDTAVPSRHPPGPHGVRLRRRRPRQGRRRHALRRRRARSARGGSNATVPMVYSADETCDVGSDTGSPVSDDYTSEDSRVHRHRQLGAARRRRRRPRPPHHARGALAGRDGPPVGTGLESTTPSSTSKFFWSRM